MRQTTGAETTGVKQSDLDHCVVSWLPSKTTMHDFSTVQIAVDIGFDGKYDAHGRNGLFSSLLSNHVIFICVNDSEGTMSNQTIVFFS